MGRDHGGNGSAGSILHVECYAGHRGEETPRALHLAEGRVEVAELLDAWLAPDHRYFKLRGADACTYLVRHDAASGRWDLVQRTPPGKA